MTTPSERITTYFKELPVDYWISFGICTWLLIAYWLWVRIPHTPSWSAYKARPTVWWKAVLWPVLWLYWTVVILAEIVFHVIKTALWSVTVDPIQERIKYGRDVVTNPEANRGDSASCPPNCEDCKREVQGTA